MIRAAFVTFCGCRLCSEAVWNGLLGEQRQMVAVEAVQQLIRRRIIAGMTHGKASSQVCRLQQCGPTNTILVDHSAGGIIVAEWVTADGASAAATADGTAKRSSNAKVVVVSIFQAVHETLEERRRSE